AAGACAPVLVVLGGVAGLVGAVVIVLLAPGLTLAVAGDWGASLRRRRRSGPSLLRGRSPPVQEVPLMVRFIPRVAASALAVLAILVASVPAVGALGEQFTVTAPAPGETVAGGTYTFAGTGEPGAAVEWLSTPDDYTQCAPIAPDGTWTCDIDIPDAPQNPYGAAIGTIFFVTTGA